MQLTIWYIQSNQGDAYSIKAKTKKAAIETLNSGECGPRRDFSDWDDNVTLLKLTLEYSSGFDLVTTVTGEGGMWNAVVDRKEYQI